MTVCIVDVIAVVALVHVGHQRSMPSMPFKNDGFGDGIDNRVAVVVAVTILRPVWRCNVLCSFAVSANTTPHLSD